MANIAIIDDEKVLVRSLSIAFTDEGHTVSEFFTGTDFLLSLKKITPEIILLDLRLPDMNGLDILDKINKLELNCRIIMITAHGDINSAIKAMKSGAYDFINKPFELDEILMLVTKALNDLKNFEEINHLREKNLKISGSSIIGESKAILNLINNINKISLIDDATVLIQGESGTGKELVAKAIHKAKNEKSPFIEINCSAFPEHLLESELFGHEKGAFTDAKIRKTGLIELADKGTLFLDEIGELPLNLQAKLLRFLETRKFRRVGGNTEINVKLKIIAATNRNLEELIEEKSFRKDLYYRLNILPICVPPLREREYDIILLSNYFIDLFSKKFSKEKLILSNSVKEIFLNYSWPGNVRELKNLIERLVIMSSNNIIESENLPIEMKINIKSKQKEIKNNDFNLDVYLAKIEYELIQDAIIKSKGIKSEAAKLLGISRHSLKRRLNKFENKN